MRPVRQIVGATGPSGWIPIDYLQRSFAIGGHCTVGGGSSPSMTYKVQHGFDNGIPDTSVLITRSTTTATLVFKAADDPPGSGNTWVNHGLSVGDCIEVAGGVGAVAADVIYGTYT